MSLAVIACETKRILVHNLREKAHYTVDFKGFPTSAVQHSFPKP